MSEENKSAYKPGKLSAVPRKGFRNAAKPTKVEELTQTVDALSALVKSTAQSLQMTQQFFSSFAQKVSRLEQDLAMALGALNDLQYRSAAIIKVNGLENTIDAISDELKLADYNLQAAEADLKEGLVEGTVVGAESTVVVTSVADDPKKSIFRSRFKLSETGNPAMSDKFLGLKVGDTVSMPVSGMNHTFTVLAIREAKPVEAAAETATETTNG